MALHIIRFVAIFCTKRQFRPAFTILVDTILVTIPFYRINKVGDKVGDKMGDKVSDMNLNISQIKVLAEIRNNPNITKPELMVKCDLGKTSIDNIIAFLRKNSIIERVGSNKTGYWKVIK